MSNQKLPYRNNSMYSNGSYRERPKQTRPVEVDNDDAKILCQFCNDIFKTDHGRKIHIGKKHKKEILKRDKNLNFTKPQTEPKLPPHFESIPIPQVDSVKKSPLYSTPPKTPSSAVSHSDISIKSSQKALERRSKLNALSSTFNSPPASDQENDSDDHNDTFNPRNSKKIQIKTGSTFWKVGKI